MKTARVIVLAAASLGAAACGGGGATTQAVTRTAPIESCYDVAIAPNSGNGLFDVEARGIACDDAEALLREWGRNGYAPKAGPSGYECDVVARYPEGGARLECSGPAGEAISFDTGN